MKWYSVFFSGNGLCQARQSVFWATTLLTSGSGSQNGQRPASASRTIWQYCLYVRAREIQARVPLSVIPSMTSVSSDILNLFLGKLCYGLANFIRFLPTSVKY